MDAGIQIEPQFGFTYQAIREIATEAEALGFSHLWVSDHFFLRPDQALTDCLEAWTLLSALTQVTTRLRLGPLVTCQSYRPPSLLAKMAAGVDVQSAGIRRRGRLEGSRVQGLRDPLPPAAGSRGAAGGHAGDRARDVDAGACHLSGPPLRD